MAGTRGGLAARLRAIDWEAVAASLDAHGYAVAPALLRPRECTGLVALYRDDGRFRSTVDMERHRFGVGDYRYFARPLPRLVNELRARAYPPLARVANGWMEALRSPRRFPASLAAFLAECRAAGQTRPTPLLLHYEAGGYNCLHQDLYGAIAFPLQMTVALSRRGDDYDGGEFLLVEQRPRAQSRGTAIPLEQGEAILFPTRERPVKGARGWHRTAMRHGVSRVTRGRRHTLGIIFHDAR